MGSYRHFTIFALVFALALVLLAGTSFAQGTVTFAGQGSIQEQQMYRAIVAAFNEKHPDIQAKYQPWPGGGWEKAITMIAGGTAPDVLRMDDDAVYELAINGRIMQLDKYVDAQMNRDDYFPIQWNGLAVDGQVYSINPTISVNTFFYNKDLFDEAGITAPTTWDDAWEWETFKANVAKLSKDINGDGRIDQFGVAAPGNLITGIIWGNNSHYFNEDQSECAFYTESNVQIVDEWFQLLYKYNYMPYPDEDQLALFNGGDLAMWWESMSQPARISQDINWDVMPMPKTPHQAITENYFRTFVVPSNTKHPDAAFKLIKFLLEEEAQVIMAKSDWGVPTLISVASSDAFQDPTRLPEHRNIWFEGMYQDAPVPNSPAGHFIDEVLLYEQAEAAMTGQVSTDQYLRSACDQVNKRLAEVRSSKN